MMGQGWILCFLESSSVLWQCLLFCLKTGQQNLSRFLVVLSPLSDFVSRCCYNVGRDGV